jgi:hypothetical protein
MAVHHDGVVWTKPPSYRVPTAPRAPGPQPTRISYGEQHPLTLCAVAEENRRRFRTLTWREGAKGPRCAPAGGRAVCKPLGTGKRARNRESRFGS